jgi:hypothetical protein
MMRITATISLSPVQCPRAGHSDHVHQDSAIGLSGRVDARPAQDAVIACIAAQRSVFLLFTFCTSIQTVSMALRRLSAASARRTRLLIGLCLLATGMPGLDGRAFGLEKYGRPLPALETAKEQAEGKEREAQESLVGGYVLTSAFISNPSFTARPDNTGRVGLRHMVHLERDIYKQYLTFYTDQNFFSDRTKGWIELSEWDMTYAFTGVVGHWNWRIQYERDAPLDKSGLKQVYSDSLITYRIRTDVDWQWWRRLAPNHTLTAYAGAGWLFHNQDYFARPDNTGRALFRYVAHFDLDLYRERAVLFGDVNMFTDRSASNVAGPSELDWIIGIALRWQDLELSLYREQDRPVDRGGFVQEYWALQLRFAFDVPKSRLAAR